MGRRRKPNSASQSTSTHDRAHPGRVSPTANAYSEDLLFFSDPIGKPAGKVFTSNAPGGFAVKSKYSMPLLLRPRQVTVRDADDFFAAVRHASELGEFLVHGIKRDDAQLDADGLMYRRKNGDDATVREIKRRGWAIDVDITAGSALHAALADCKVHVFANIDAAAKSVAELALPAWLRTGPLMWHASGSCGLQDPSLARFHYFCWLDRPVKPGLMKALIASHNADLQAQGLSDTARFPCDTALYQGVQPVYLAATFEGRDDPLPVRFGMIKSKQAATSTPETKNIKPAGKASARAAIRSGAGGYEPLLKEINWPGQIDACLKLIGDGLDQLGFHLPLLHVTYRMAWSALRDGEPLTDQWVEQHVAKLRQAIEAAPSGGRTADEIEHYKLDVERYLKEGYEKASARQREQAAFVASIGPVYPKPGLPLSAAEAAMQLAIQQFVTKALAWGSSDGGRLPPRMTLAASPGLGKSHSTMLAILELIDLAKSRVIVVVPTHKLAEEWAAQCKKMATEKKRRPPAIRIVKGRKQPAMCEPPAHQRAVIKETIAAAVKLGVSARQSACEACGCKLSCPYLQQWEDHGPGLLVVPQAYFRNGAIPGVSRTDVEGAAPIALVVIDESITNALSRQQSVPVDALREGLGTSRVPGFAAQALVGVRAKTLDCHALSKVRDDDEFVHQVTCAIGSLLRSNRELPLTSVSQAFENHDDGQTWAQSAADRFRAAEKKLAHDVQVQMRHAASKKEFNAVGSDMRQRLEVVRWMVAFLELLDHHSRTPSRGRVVGVRTYKVRVTRGGKKKKVRRAELNYFGELPEFAIRHPLLILDATAEREIVKLTLARSPRSKEKVVSIRAEAEHARLTLVKGAPTRMGELAPKDLGESQRMASDHPIERLHALIWMLENHACRHKRLGTVGLITYKRTCAYFDRHGLLTDVPKMHFGALRGLNDLENISTLVIAGRLWPNERDLDRQTEALLAFDPEGRERGGSSLKSELRGVRMRGGGCEIVPQTEHASKIADSILIGLVDAEVTQALGRARALRRTDDNPVHILLLADRVIDATFDEVVRADAVLPSATTAMQIGQGTTPETAKAAWAVGRGLFSSLEQAQRWAEANGGQDHAGEEYWLAALGKQAPRVKTVALPGLHKQKFRLIGGPNSKFRRIFNVKPVGKKNGALVFRQVSDVGDLDAPVVQDKRSPGSQITRRKAIELWKETLVQDSFARALGKHLKKSIGRSTARTILRALKPFLADEET